MTAEEAKPGAVQTQAVGRLDGIAMKLTALFSSIVLGF